MTEEMWIATDIELSRSVLQDLIDIYCTEKEEYRLASGCIDTLYALASMYQGLVK